MNSPKLSNRIAVATLLCLVASASQAHTGHGTNGILEGLQHPFGLDHLLAMVGVGIWSVSALPENKAWWGPATFMAALVVSAFLGTQGVSVPYLENLISLSVILFGAMLLLSRFHMSPKAGLALIALAASMHGLAHGAESPESGFVAYAVGFLLTTACLHFGGVALGLGIKRYVPSKVGVMNTTAGLICGGAGAYLFSQL